MVANTPQTTAPPGQSTMGRFSVEMEVANERDVILANEGLLSPEKVRRVKLNGVVDTGATRLVLPAKAVEHLGLEENKSIDVRLADGRKDKRMLVAGAHVWMLGRDSVFNALVEPGRSDALIGAIVMEDLDFIVDCTTQQLRPRDPKTIIAEIE